MRRPLWIGAAALVAAAAAIPLWLVIDDGGVRRLGAIDSTASGQAGQLTLAGVNAGAPIPIDSFAFVVRRPVGAAQPELDAIEVSLPLATNMTQLVTRAVQGSKAATGKVELVRSINGTLTAYLTFNLTNVSVDGFDDSYSTLSPSAQLDDGAEAITLRYDAMTMSCIPSVCAEPTHPQGTGTELAVPGDGALAVRLDSGNFSVPKNFDKGGSIAATAVMGPSYLLPALFARAREGTVSEKTVRVELVRSHESSVRKVATYKLGAAVVTSLAINYSGEALVVRVGFSSDHFGVTTYTYTSAGVQDKASTSCYPNCNGL